MRRRDRRKAGRRYEEETQDRRRCHPKDMTRRLAHHLRTFRSLSDRTGNAASVPNLKFAKLCSTLRANFGFDKDTSNLMTLVSFMDQKFARWTRGNEGCEFLIHDTC